MSECFYSNSTKVTSRALDKDITVTSHYNTDYTVTSSMSEHAPDQWFQELLEAYWKWQDGGLWWANVPADIPDITQKMLRENKQFRDRHPILDWQKDPDEKARDAYLKVFLADRIVT